jgi:16S rRNA (cytidine1402-2'-O)-methyltransferase
MPLYIVATPLGNLSDVSTRAAEHLRTADVIAAEDTRSARRLFGALDIPLAGRKLISYGDHNERSASSNLAEDLETGRDVALISEGGTPLISDPGYRLVQAAINAGVPVVPIPGPCAAIAALCASGLPVHAFLFRGFLPKKPGARRRILENLKDREETLIFYESPQRLGKLLPELINVLGADRPACVAREITKMHEAFWRGSLSELVYELQVASPAKGVKGECTVLVSGVRP